MGYSYFNSIIGALIMTIENYKLVKDISQEEPSTLIIRLSDGAYIPFDPANTDYEEFLAWKSKGNTPEPVDEETE